MIDFVAITNDVGDRMEMPLADPSDSGLAVISVDGLGPAKGTINLTDISSSDGSIFNSSRIKNRNITLKLQFIPDFSIGRTVEDVRLATYKYFPVKRPVIFEVKTDHRWAAIAGYVESNEPDIFSNKAGCHISILCPDPYFYSLDTGWSGDTSFSALNGGFEFAFENNDLNNPLLKFGDIKLLEEVNIPYYGDATTGMTIWIHALGKASNVMLVKTQEYKTLSLNTSKFSLLGLTPNIVSGDDIFIDTRRGHKSVRLVRGGKEYNIINALDRKSDWLQLNHGDNIFSYKASSGGLSLQVKLEYTTMYEGV